MLRVCSSLPAVSDLSAANTGGCKSEGAYARAHAQSLRCVRLFVTPQTVAHQAPLSMGFSRQEHCSELPFPPPGDFFDPVIKPVSLASPASAAGFISTTPPGKPKSEGT